MFLIPHWDLFKFQLPILALACVFASEWGFLYYSVFYPYEGTYLLRPAQLCALYNLRGSSFCPSCCGAFTKCTQQLGDFALCPLRAFPPSPQVHITKTRCSVGLSGDLGLKLLPWPLHFSCPCAPQGSPSLCCSLALKVGLDFLCCKKGLLFPTLLSTLVFGPSPAPCCIASWEVPNHQLLE